MLEAWSLDGSGIEFDHTTIALNLLAGPGQPLDSRAQARRVAARLPMFRRAEINFDGVVDVGHGFTDELFRVFAKAHREVIRKFGRFPFRNAALDRDSTVHERRWLAEGGYGATVREFEAMTP